MSKWHTHEAPPRCSTYQDCLLWEKDQYRRERDEALDLLEKMVYEASFYRQAQPLSLKPGRDLPETVAEGKARALLDRLRVKSKTPYLDCLRSEKVRDKVEQELRLDEPDRSELVASVRILADAIDELRNRGS